MECTLFERNHFTNYQTVVILAKENGQVLFCQKKGGSSWETPGGHIEQREKPLDAARRQLMEETGAVQFTLTPLFDFWAAKETGGAAGMVFYANVTQRGPLPADYEMAKVQRFSTLPEPLTYPEITPLLLERFEKLVKMGEIKE